jgi:ADP-heptose:LPS heptosyltransferase
MKKIIIFRTDRLGDYIIHSRPIYELKKKIIDSKIIVVCSNLNKKILIEHDYIDELIVYDKKLPILKKIKVFFKIFLNNYFASFILDGKNFSYLCNIFLISKFKFGVCYKSFRSILGYKFEFIKPSKIYALFFFTKYELFTSRKFLTRSENLCQKYLNLFNFFNLDLKITDNYIFYPSKKSINLFKSIKDLINLNNFVLIHFDEKWLDVLNNETELVEAINNLYLQTKKTIILTSFNNNFRYYNILKQKFSYFNLDNSTIKHLRKSNIMIFDNLEIFLFERFLNNSLINISCHSGFVAQVCGANNSKLIDVINEKDKEWYSCWTPLNTFHKFIYKSSVVNGAICPKIFFTEIIDIVKKL